MSFFAPITSSSPSFISENDDTTTMVFGGQQQKLHHHHQQQHRKISLQEFTTMALTQLNEMNDDDDDDGGGDDGGNQSDNDNDNDSDDSRSICSHNTTQDSINSGLSIRSENNENIIGIPMGGHDNIPRVVARKDTPSRNVSEFPPLEPFQQHQRFSTLRQFIFDSSMLRSVDNKKGDFHHDRNGNNQDDSNSYWDAKESLDPSPASSDRISLDVFEDEQFMDSLQNIVIKDGDNYNNGSSSRRVRFAEDEDGPELIERGDDDTFPNQRTGEEYLMHALDIFHDQPGSGPFDDINSSTRSNFYNTIYNDDNYDEANSSEYPSDEEEDRESLEKKIVRGTLYSVGGIALARAIEGARKLFSALRNSSDSDPNAGVGEFIESGGENGIEASEMTVNPDSASNSSSSSLQGSSSSLNSSSSAASSSASSSASVSSASASASSVSATATGQAVTIAAQ